MSYYCIKDILVRRLEQSEYERIKSLWAWKEDIAQSQSLAVVQFNPENILKRMNFRQLKENAIDWKLFDYWQPAAATSNYLELDAGSAIDVDYFAFYSSNLYTEAGATWITFHRSPSASCAL